MIGTPPEKRTSGSHAYVSSSNSCHMRHVAAGGPHAVAAFGTLVATAGVGIDAKCGSDVVRRACSANACHRVRCVAVRTALYRAQVPGESAETKADLCAAHTASIPPMSRRSIATSVQLACVMPSTV